MRMNNELSFVDRYIEEFVSFLSRTPSDGSNASTNSAANNNSDTLTMEQQQMKNARNKWRQALIHQRLLQLRALMGKRKGPQLTLEQVSSIHSSLSTNLSDQNIFMDWLAKCVRKDDFLVFEMFHIMSNCDFFSFFFFFGAKGK